MKIRKDLPVYNIPWLSEIAMTEWLELHGRGVWRKEKAPLTQKINCNPLLSSTLTELTWGIMLQSSSRFRPRGQGRWLERQHYHLEHCWQMSKIPYCMLEFCFQSEKIASEKMNKPRRIRSTCILRVLLAGPKRVLLHFLEVQFSPVSCI